MKNIKIYLLKEMNCFTFELRRTFITVFLPPRKKLIEFCEADYEDIKTQIESLTKKGYVKELEIFDIMLVEEYGEMILKINKRLKKLYDGKYPFRDAAIRKAKDNMYIADIMKYLEQLKENEKA